MFWSLRRPGSDYLRELRCADAPSGCRARALHVGGLVVALHAASSSRRQTDFTASPACAPTYCCAAAQGAAMGSLPIARTLLSVLGTLCVVACERRNVEVNVSALGRPCAEVPLEK